MANKRQILEAINQELARANGGRHVRTLDMSDVAQVIREALERGYGWVGGGTVANAYKYPARQTAALAGASKANVRITIGTLNAHGITSAYSWWGLSRASKVDKLVQAGALFADGQMPFIAQRELSMTRRQAREILRDLDRRAVRNMIPDDLAADDTGVTYRDSILAGNCKEETDKVREWFQGQSQVPVRRLLQEVAKREPRLMPYAVRACRRAIDQAKRPLPSPSDLGAANLSPQ